MKQKLLNLATALLLCSASASAQTDVTSTYLINADFSQGTPVTVGTCTYDYDKSKNGTTFCQLVDVEGWTIPANGNGKAGGLIAFGSGVWIGGPGYNAPATNSDGDAEGNILGLVGVWTGTAQYTQNVTLPAGTYTLVLGVYNSKGGTVAFSKNLIGFIENGGTEHLATTTVYSVNTWKYEFIQFTLAAETSGKISLGYTSANKGSGDMPHLFLSGIQLFDGEVDAAAYEAAKEAAREAKEAKVLWDNAVAAANAALADAAYANVIGVEKAAVEAELAKAEPATKDAYNEATAALTTATDAFKAAKASYDALVSEIAYAKTIAVATADAEAALNADADATSVVTATQALKVLEYTTINSAYANDVTSLLGTWGKGTYDTTSGQGYVGSESYFDKWNGSATDLTSSATVTLPAGKYVVKVAGRGVSTTTMNLSVKVGVADAVSTPFIMNGDTGKGIDTAGTTNFSEEGTYSNNNAGRGWQYRYIAFETTGEEVTITINGHLNGNTWQSFYAPVLLCDDDTYAPIAVDATKAELQAAIDAAPAVRTANIGDGVFQIAEAGVNTYAAAVEAANAALADGAATLESLATAKSTFEAAIAAYQALELNAPADGQLFNVVLTFAGWTYDQKAMTYLANDRKDAGLYNIQYKEAANTNLAQAFTFTKVEGNKYKMSQIDADGVVRYISTGETYGGNASQIRTVTEADKALLVEVIPTNVEGVYNLRNTEANNYIGSQDAGVYTVNSHIDFKLVETTKPSIAINTTAAGWGTVMLPFAVASLPTDVKAYTCDAIDGQTLTLIEATALKANKPYIIEGAWEENVTGDAQGTALTYTEGLLTGTYAKIAAPVGSYVLQNQSDVVGFYQVEDGTIPNVPANRAYLTTDPSTDVKAFFLGGNADAIQSVFTKVAAGEIYDLAGRKVQKMQKGGVYIIDGKKVSVK